MKAIRRILSTIATAFAPPKPAPKRIKAESYVPPTNTVQNDLGAQLGVSFGDGVARPVGASKLFGMSGHCRKLQRKGKLMRLGIAGAKR